MDVSFLPWNSSNGTGRSSRKFSSADDTSNGLLFDSSTALPVRWKLSQRRRNRRTADRRPSIKNKPCSDASVSLVVANQLVVGSVRSFVRSFVHVARRTLDRTLLNVGDRVEHNAWYRALLLLEQDFERCTEGRAQLELRDRLIETNVPLARLRIGNR